VSDSLSDWVEPLISGSDGILECRYGEEECEDETRDPKVGHFGKRGFYTTIALGIRHPGLGRASLPQKLARARLLAHGPRPASEDHWLEQASKISNSIHHSCG
jgi:hypothetical protein